MNDVYLNARLHEMYRSYKEMFYVIVYGGNPKKIGASDYYSMYNMGGEL